jgi:hypothetical protein
MRNVGLRRVETRWDSGRNGKRQSCVAYSRLVADNQASESRSRTAAVRLRNRLAERRVTDGLPVALGVHFGHAIRRAPRSAQDPGDSRAALAHSPGSDDQPSKVAMQMQSLWDSGRNGNGKHV